MPTLCRRTTTTPAVLGRGQIGAVRVAALRRELRALGWDRFTTESAVSLSVSWAADVLADVAHAQQNPPVADALLGEAAAVLAAVRPVRPPTRRPVERGPLPAGADGGPECPPRLTAREAVVLRRLQGAQSLREIGVDLYVSVNTVKSHVRSIYRKFDVTSRDEAVSRARGLRLL
ncbi:LuxR C-terminal-related transcriptional regulator [Streptomyces sp. NPDC102406]|uniref:helix-turn-helix transcriptional regulator n=1 Tax=Streptomyces sp. NPDC102406 TaxID=3366171 RepID=UPI0037F1A121